MSPLEGDPATLAQSMLVGMDRGRCTPWADLRRDDLAPPRAAEQLQRTLWLVTLLAVVCLLATAGILLWRAQRYRQRADALLERQETVYQELYPGKAVPLDVKGRLQSEARKVDALSGLAQALPQQPQALATLRQVIQALPESVRLRITDIQITPNRVLLEGQLRQHADAETLYRSLAGAGLEMEAPRTEALRKGGVAFTLIGSLPQDNDTTAAGSTGRTP